ncbi:hypothetical protein BDV93DRAFT_276683 [Ceratobasidium sp. AG-I]|nr:hypothetical protein BDV93DRAFT_276683 [Ceratobasidium sp. AG-I]
MNRVGIFWDYENCAPPTGTPGYVVAERLRAACGVHGSITQFRAYLELSTSHTPQPNLNTSNSSPPGSNLGGSTDPSPDVFSYPSTSPKTLALRSELQSSGVSLIDCPHNSRKNVADTMLACDLVCFALDHPTTPHVPQAGFIPSSPYSIPSTPFSYIPAPPVTPPKTTVILVSGDRDFAYPLAVLKARRYEVGLIVPPGGAHPALRAQASWVLNWKDVLEDAGAKGDLGAGAGVRRGTDVAGADGHSSGLGVLMGVSGQPIESRPIMRRSSFASRRGSVSASRRGSMSTPTNSVPPVPPPPPELPPTKALLSSTHASPGSSVHGGPTTPARRPPLPPPPPEEPSPSPQTSVGPRSARRPSVRRAAKAGSRPPSRSRSRAGMRGGRQERTEQEATSPGLVEQQRPRPTIVPVALTPSPVGSVGPSFAGMSPRVGGSFLREVITANSHLPSDTR